ncbi:MAG: hypothetical protein ACH350_07325 [Parachlamydiaceae bacterium]
MIHYRSSLKKIFLFLMLSIILSSYYSVLHSNEGSSKLSSKCLKPKVLILVTSSNDLPVYAELRNIWRGYMHTFPDCVEAYFIEADPTLTGSFEIKEDIILTKCNECIIPGIMQKTLLTMEAFLPKIDEFDFIIKTNLSSFYIIPRLLDFLETLPLQKCYCGSLLFDWNICSGAGIIFSKDVVELMLENKSCLFNSSDYDDVAIGKFMKSNGIKAINAPRVDFLNTDMWLQHKDDIPSDTFHIRTKHPENLRATLEVAIQRELFMMFYFDLD